MDLREISDRWEITDVITRYTRAVDTRDWAALERDVFTADAELDYSAVDGPVGPPGEVVGWIERGMAGFARYQHVIGQVAITFAGADRAEVTAYFTNPMVAAGPDGREQVWEVGGYYHHTMVRTPDGWRSARLVDEVVWTRGF